MQRSPTQYRQALIDLADRIPAYEELKTFAETSQKLDGSSAKICIVQFNDNSAPDFADIVEDDLPMFLNNTQSSKLFIIENLSTNLMELLGSQFSVEFEFWLDHVSKLNWFRLGEIEKHLPALESIQLDSKYIRHRFIGPRELSLNTPGQFVEDRIEAEPGSTRVPRLAGALNPSERLPRRPHRNVRSKECFRPVALTRQHVSMWFDSVDASNPWKTGVILLDPPFQPVKKLGRCQNPSYRSFSPGEEPNLDITYRSSFISCLKQNKILQNGGIFSPIIVMGDMYRIIASEWVVVNTCFQRELNTIEWNLENEDPELEHLYKQLTSLYITRRRVTLYEILIKEQREACRQHGRRSWNGASSPSNQGATEHVVSTLETDFAFVSNLVEKNQQRVAKNVNLLVSLITVAESRVGISNGRRIEALTLAAIFFMPFTLVSSIMNMEGDLGPGQPRQYIFCRSWIS